MQEAHFTLFETPVGRCGIVWNERGVAGVQLPEARVAATRARLVERFPNARESQPPPRVANAIAAIVALLEGRPSDLRSIALDFDRVPPFHRKVYEAARALAPGSTLSYGAIAQRVESPGSARAVGQALARNPFAIIVPCHRVLAAGGKPGGFTARGGVETKRRLLALEGTALERPNAPPRLLQPSGETALEHLRRADPVLGELIARLGPLQIPTEPTSSLFAALAEAIVYQQLTGKAAGTIFSRVRALFPARRLTPGRLLELDDTELRGAGLSHGKLSSLQDLARRTASGELPTLARVRKMSDDEIVEALTVVRGIGRWTAEMLLLFRLGRPDVLPLDDYGIKKGFALVFGKRELPTPNELAAHGARWRPYRSLASYYLWRALDSAKPAA